jgi:hypothetical protein
VGGRVVGGVKIPESTKSSLSQRLSARARERWPTLSAVNVRFRSGVAYVDGQIGDEVTPLLRLRYSGSAGLWGFAVYRASHGDYEESFLSTGVMGGSPQEALDCACGLYLGDPAAWISQL